VAVPTENLPRTEISEKGISREVSRDALPVSTRDPSLRLKNGSVQDDAFGIWVSNIKLHHYEKPSGPLQRGFTQLTWVTV
jgi:hypothetical protein